MAWKECLFLEASKETGGEFQMQCLGSVKEIYQDKIFSHYLPHRHFSASLLKQLMQPLSGKYGEHKGEEVQWGPGGLFKKILLQQLECSYHIDLCQHLSQRRWQEKEVKWKQSEVSSLETAKITFRNIYWGPEAVSSHCVAACPSNPFFIPVTSVASMDPTLEEFRLAIKYSSPTWDSTSHFLGHKVVMSVK